MKIKVLALLAVLALAVGAIACTKQKEEPIEPTMSEVETPVEAPVEQPMETPAETPIEGDTAVEGQPAADETTATGNLGGSAGENNFGMTNLMDSIKDNDQTDVEHSLDLEEQKQETPIEGAVGSDVGSGNGTGSDAQTGVPSQPQAPSNPQSQTPSDGKYSSKEAVESLDSVKEVTGYNEQAGGWEVTRGSGAEQVMLPDGTTMDKEFLDIFFPDGK